MNDSSTPLASSSAAQNLSLESLAQAYQSLRAAFHVTLVLLFILTASLFVFFMRETSIARRQILQLSQAVAEYDRTAVPVMKDLRNKLQAFAATHADFAPIYTKYFGATSAPAAGPGAVPAQPVNGARLPPPR